MCWGSNGSRSRWCVFATKAFVHIHWYWSPFEEEASMVLCSAWGKCMLTLVLWRCRDAQPQLQTAVETGKIPGLIPEFCCVVMVHMLPRDSSQIIQISQGTGGLLCEQAAECKQAFCILSGRFSVHEGMFKYCTQIQGLIVVAGMHTRSLLPRLLS